MTKETAMFLAIAAAVFVGVVLYNAWRHPEKACWKCQGSAWVRALSAVFRIDVRGACRKCGGRGWHQRRLSRFSAGTRTFTVGESP